MDQTQVENKTEEKIIPEQNTIIDAVPADLSTGAAKDETPKNSKDWDNFRKARAAERKQAEEVARKAADKEAEVMALKAAMDAILSNPKQKQSNQDHSYDEVEETEEQRIDRRVSAAIAQREAENEKRRAEREQAEYPQKLNSTYKDFGQVVTTENLDYLDYHYPEVAQAFKYAPDGFDKWAGVYQAVKRFVPNTDTRKDQARMEKNINKPQSISSPQINPGKDGAPPTRLEESRKAENWARMQRALKGLTS